MAINLVPGHQGNDAVLYTMVTARVTVHRDTLEAMSKDEKNVQFEIPLPFHVQPYVCRGDNLGVENAREGMDVGVYRHEEPNFQANNQFVWMLHMELSAY